MKDSKLDGKRLIELPEKKVGLVQLEFSPEERDIYRMVIFMLKVDQEVTDDLWNRWRFVPKQNLIISFVQGLFSSTRSFLRHKPLSLTVRQELSSSSCALASFTTNMFACFSHH